jgi:hypothetical protein
MFASAIFEPKVSRRLKLHWICMHEAFRKGQLVPLCGRRGDKYGGSGSRSTRLLKLHFAWPGFDGGKALSPLGRPKCPLAKVLRGSNQSSGQQTTDRRSSVVSNQQCWSPVAARVSFSCRISLWISVLVLIFCSATFRMRHEKSCSGIRKDEPPLPMTSRIKAKRIRPGSDCRQSPRNHQQAPRH